jgi:hypothetical protein
MRYFLGKRMVRNMAQAEEFIDSPNTTGSGHSSGMHISLQPTNELLTRTPGIGCPRKKMADHL